MSTSAFTTDEAVIKMNHIEIRTVDKISIYRNIDIII